MRSDGTPVRGYSRWAQGARREMTLLAVVAVAVIGMGGGTTSAGSAEGGTPRPQPAVKYPVRFEDATEGRAGRARPQPTVSYPIKFDTPVRKPVVPRPTVSYPIDFSTMGSGR
ncbi:hypothetical protein ACFWII_38375 [Streptomyces sp. NPDC127063]|uniref:hypothetical protein n=1 Tax=Streptomyces sp. NPDC127063 TaxID=3347123 RepID=UPI00364FB178